MCLETLTEPALIQSLIKVLIATETKIRDLNLLEVILSKMNTSEMVFFHVAFTVYNVHEMLLVVQSCPFAFADLIKSVHSYFPML